MTKPGRFYRRSRRTMPRRSDVAYDFAASGVSSDHLHQRSSPAMYTFGKREVLHEYALCLWKSYMVMVSTSVNWETLGLLLKNIKTYC